MHCFPFYLLVLLSLSLAFLFLAFLFYLLYLLAVFFIIFLELSSHLLFSFINQLFVLFLV